MAHGLYDGSLESIPGLGGYLQQTRINNAQTGQNMQQGVQIMSMLKAAKEQEDDAKIREALTVGGAPEQVLMNLAKVGPSGLATANHYMSAMKAMRESDALRGLNMSDPEALEKASILTGNASMSALAQRMRQQKADQATQKTLTSQETPITQAPTFGVANGAPAYRSIINGPEPAPGAIPPEVQAAMDSGKPFSIGVGQSSNPAENVQKTGGLFESLMNSPIEAIRGQAVNSQRQVDTSDPLSVKPSHWIDMQGKLAGQESSQLMTQALAGQREPLQAVVRNGRPELVPRSQAVGMTPYSPNDSALVPVKNSGGTVTYVPRVEAAGREVGTRVTDTNIAKSVQQLGKDFEKAGLPTAIKVLDDASKLITPEMAQYLTGPKSVLPDRMVTPEARDARQALAKLFNITLKDRSGAAVTIQELDRLKDEFGKGLIKTSGQLINAIARAKSALESHYNGIAASYGKPTLDAYNENLSAIGGTPFSSAEIKAGGQVPALPPGFKIERVN